MHDIIVQVLTYARGIWRYRWYLVIVAWAVCITGWFAVYQMPDEYKASTRIYIDTNTVLRPLLRGLAVDTGLRSQINIMTRTLLSRPNMEKLARMTDLDLKAKDPNKMDALITDLKDDISISQPKRAKNLYTISYEHKDRQLAKRIVQSLLTIFIESALGESRKNSDSAQKFLDGQIKEYEAKLLAAEERLKEFKRKNIGVMPREGQTYFKRLESALAILEEAKLVRQEAINRRDEMQRQMEDAEPELTAFQGEPTFSSPLDSRIHNLQVRLDELLLNYTDKHPDVINIKRTIVKLERKKKKEMKEVQSGDDEVLYDKTNPVYQQMKISLSEAEANVASFTARVDEYQKRSDSLKKLMDTIPQVEAELKNLNRDYGVHKKNYNILLSRRESARISQDVERSSDNVNFRVIDPPHVPSQPSGPNRPLFMSIVLFVALGLGTGVALLLYMIKPSFDTRRTLSDATGLPVLGSVSMIWSPAQIQERHIKILVFGASSLALIIIYGLLVAQQFIFVMKG